nr:reverse transcriptase domain-containing protein [Tanacetum cinerariifolium]
MACPVEGGGPEGTDDREGTPPPLMKEHIKGHVSTLKSLIKSHNQRHKGDPVRLDFDRRIQRYSVRRACFKEPREIPKIVNKANESLTSFKERWTVETGFIMGVPEVMKISSFMDSVKSQKLAKRFSDKVPTTVNEMMERLDDFLRSEEAYAITELLKWEVGETHRKTSLPFNRRDNRLSRNTHPGESRRNEYRSNYRSGRDAYLANRTRDDRASYPPPRGEYNHRVALVLILESLTKRQKEILAMKTQLHLPAPRPMLNPLRGRGPYDKEAPQPAKVINVINVNSVKDKKRKGIEIIEMWINILISFPAISSEDVYEEPLIIEAEMEGYLVKRVYVDEGLSVEVMFEHYFENLYPRIKAKLKETQTDLVGFTGEISKPLRKIELEECFGNEGLCRRTSMKFIVVRALPPYKIILRRPGRLEKKQMIEEISKGERVVAATKEVLVNPSFPDQRVTICGGLSEACKDQLKYLLKDNMRVFAWEPSDMIGVPRATYQRLVDLTFQYQIGRNLKEYVDDMVIKSKDEKMLLANIAETFDYLKRINMKLNPKKCSFRVEEEKFLGYMVTSKGIRSNPKKTKALVDLQSPRMPKEMNGRQCRVQYVSMTLNEAERNYAPMEKLSLSLIHMTRRLRRSTGRRNEELYFRMPEVPLEKDDTKSWTLFTDWASSPKGSGACLVLIGPIGIEYTYTLRLTFPSTNNEAEYKALLARLRIARQMNISNIRFKVDSKLMASQINGIYEASKDIMIKYLAKAKEYAFVFKSFSIENIPRNMNQKADVLSKLASMAFNHLTKEVLVEVLNERSTEIQEVHIVVEEERDNWMTPIIWCLEQGLWHTDKNEARGLRAKIGQYAMESRVRLKKGYLVPMLRCIGPLQAKYAIREIHMGSYGMHVGPRAVVRKAVKQGYYWPTMHEDAKKEVEKCDSCQIHALVLRLPKTVMTSIIAPWPFYQWGMDILGPLSSVRGGAKFVIVAIDYFTKWIEAKPLVKITSNEEMRETTTVREARYKTKMENYYNKKVRPSGFRPREFVF